MPRPTLRRPVQGPAGGPLFVAYYRVSTDQQGRSGLGLDAQKAAVASFLASQSGAKLAAEFEEVESGKRVDRPQLTAALAACRARRAVLVIAKIDRLARNARFLLSVVEGVGDAGVAFCDLPQIPPGPTGKFLLTLLAAVAELEAGLISQRTKAALAQAKARGVKLGAPRLQKGIDSASSRAGRAAQTARAVDYLADVWPFIEAAQRAGASSLRQVAEALTARGVRPPSGGEVWHAKQVSRLLQQRKAA
ncbi:recombinase family protein [Pararoseomonas indoligenes]|uniref:Recombinase family protein n=1 Tax=Roseomonas indoligenes TaxID=2820811 RepID=A0A940MSZ7_9PROT|nr:recombinase family protein [Pararoseomonas indoligenes]MBP0492859.1 recombinase family protein [Pararoseomonas indoligenes]